MKKLLLAAALLAVTGMGAKAQLLLAGWDFQGGASGTVGSSAAAQPGSPTSFISNAGAFQSGSTLFADGTNGSSSWLQATELDGFGGSNLNVLAGMNSSTSGASSLALEGGTANSANGKSLVFRASTLGYEDIQLAFATRGTATGFNSHTWEWSTNGLVWNSFWTNTAITTSTFVVQSFDASSISGLDNQADVYFRLTLNGASSASGNNRIDNFTILGTAVPEPTVAAMLVGSFGMLALRRRRA